MPAVLSITPLGNLGNQMLQLMMALSLANRVPGLKVVGYELPLWNLRSPAIAQRPRRAVPLEGHLIDLDLASALIRLGILREMELRGYGFRMENYLPRPAYQATFSRSEPAPEGGADDTLVINIRGAEILGNCHPDYGPVPVAFYGQLIERTGLRPLFLGQIGDDYYSKMLRSAFPHAGFIQSRGPLMDFEMIRSSRNIVASVSTFSWLAAWLSDAQTVHVPVLGFLNPRQRPDVDLLPWSDERYSFYEFPTRSWAATERQIADLATDRVYGPIERSGVQRMLAEARALIDGAFRRGRRQLVGRALVHWLGLDRLRRTRIAGVEAPSSAGAAAGAVPRSIEAAGTDGRANAVAERSANEWLRDGYRRHQSGELAQAAQCYRFVLQLDPDNADANYLLGEIALRQKDFAAAVQWIGRAVSVNPGVAAFHFDLGLALYETGSNERAVDSYRKAIELDPGDPGTHYFLGVALQAMGRLDEANETFLQALQLKLKRDSGGSAHARGPRRAVPRTTLCCIDCRYHDLAIAALKRSLAHCRFEQVLFFTDRDFELQGIRVVRIAPIRSLAEYSRFVIKELNRHVETDFALLIQYDGFVLNGRHWSDAFLDYDYIGAKWTFTDGHNVGNGGFSLRSKRLLVALQDPRVQELVPEDLAVCRTYRRLLESEYGIRFAPDEVAERFSFEVVQPPGGTFGFHGIGHLVRIIDMSDTELERYESGPVIVHITPEQSRVGAEARPGFGDPKE